MATKNQGENKKPLNWSTIPPLISAGVAVLIVICVMVWYIAYMYGRMEAPPARPDGTRPGQVVQGDSRVSHRQLWTILPDESWSSQESGEVEAEPCEVVGDEVGFLAKLEGGDAYAEFFLDLRSLELPGMERNEDGTYDLSGKTIKTRVRSDASFVGESSAHNGVEISLKNPSANWETILSPYKNVERALSSPAGMPLSWRVPTHSVSKHAGGLTVKFTIGSDSTDTYEGNFYLQKVEISGP